MLGKTRRVHFVGIGGIGMSGIAELLANLGYAVSGSDEKASPTTDRLASLGIRVARGHDAANVGDADVVVVSSAVGRGEPGSAGSGAAARAGHPARRDARGADAAPLRRGGRRRAWQDDDDVDDRAGARTGRARSDGGHRRPAERLRQQRPARQGRADGGRGGRERPVVSEAVSDDCGDDQHRPRAPRELRRLRRPPAGVRRVRQQGAVLWRGHRVRRRPEPGRDPPAPDAARDDLRPRGARRRRDGERRRARSAERGGDRAPPRARRGRRGAGGRDARAPRAAGARAAQPAERARGRRRRPGAGPAVRAHRRRPRRLSRRGAALRGPRRAERHPRRRRLRASPDRDRGRDGGREGAESPDRRGVPAAPLHADGACCCARSDRRWLARITSC